MKETVPAYRRHDISDETWALLEPHLPGRRGVWGGIAEDNRLFLSMRFSGFCARGRRGGIYHRTMADGGIRTVASFAGAIQGSGKSDWRF